MIAARFQKSGIHIFIIATACLYYLLNAPMLLGHYDLGWHLAAGDLIRAKGAIPLTDHWAFTSAGQQWFNLSWLWDVFASALFEYAKFPGLIILVVGWGAAIAGCLTSICLRSGASAPAVCVCVLLTCLLYPAFAAFPNIYLSASPNMATMLFSVMFYGACLRQTRIVFLLPVLMLLWANLHGGFVIGFFVIGIFAATVLLKRDWEKFTTYGVVAGSCFLATFINPLGWHIYQGVTSTLGNFVQSYITEWWPYYRNITLPGSLPGMIYILAFAGLELRGGSKCPPEARLLSRLFLLLGFYQFRYMAFFFLFSAVPMALHLDRLLADRWDGAKVEKSLLFAGIVAVCALPLAALKIDPAIGLPQMVSQQDVGYLESHFPHARLLNHWNYGGLLIFRMRGAIPIFVDGRAATAYPESLLRDYVPLAQTKVDEAAWDKVLGKYRIDTVLWVRAHQELRQFLVARRGWKEAYTGQYASIYVKP